MERFAEERESILSRKMDTLLRECGDYLALSLKSAEMVQSERQALKQQVVGEKEIVDETKSSVRLMVQYAAAGTRSMVANRLETHQSELERALLEGFESEFPKWTRSLATMLTSFEAWLASALRDELTVLSLRERNSFLPPLHKVQKQALHALQQFRDRLSDAPCGPSACRCEPRKPRSTLSSPEPPISESAGCSTGIGSCCRPFCRYGRFRPPFTAILRARISYLLYQNLSRLSAQWEESVNSALWGVEKEARRRLDELIATVERLVESSSNERAPQLREDLDRLESARKSLAAETQT